MKYFKDLLKQEKFIFLLIFLVFVLFPTNNSGLDAYNYAANVKYNQDLFLPHHLLYNALMYVLYYPIKWLEIDVLLFIKMINSAFVIGILFVFSKTVTLLEIHKNTRINYLLLLAFSFSVWRYGTENETYIIPIFFSLLGSLFFLKYRIKPELKFVFISGIFTAIACLFHQIHFFWWLGLMIGYLLDKNWMKGLIVYIFTALVVPTAYLLVIKFYKYTLVSYSSLVQYVFHDFYSGTATSEFGWNNIVLIIINSIRTFFQIHSNIYILIKSNFLFTLPLLVMLYFIINILNHGYKRVAFTKKVNKKFQFFSRIHLLIFVLHFLFAFYAVGNVEFMVMLPFLLVLGLITQYELNTKLLNLGVITLFVWNFTYGIYPNYHYKYYNDEVLVNFIMNHPKDVFIVKNEEILNMYYYKTGINNYQKIILYNEIEDESALKSIFMTNNNIYTDIIDKPTLFNRATIVTNKSKKVNFKKYKKDKVLSYNGLYGTSTIYQIQD